MRPKRILIIRIDGIGDLLCVTPTLKAVRQQFPEVSIDFLANLGPHIVLDGNPDIDRLLIDYRSKVSGSRLRGLCYLPYRFMAWCKRKFQGYDLVVVAHYGMHDRAMAIAQSTKCPTILANIEPEHKAGVHDPRIRFADFLHGMHEVDGVFEAIRPVIGNDKAGRMWAFPQPNVLEDPDGWHQSVTPLLIGINLSASVSERFWPVANFISLIQALATQYPAATFAITGLAADIDRFNALTKGLGQSIDQLFYFSTPSLKAYIAAISVCTLYVSIEGGGVHLASALAKPQVALFQKTKVARWHPWAVPHRIVSSDTVEDAISQIKVEQVLSATNALLTDLGY